MSSKTPSINEKEHVTHDEKDVKIVEARGAAIAAAYEAGHALNPWSKDSLILFAACFVRVHSGLSYITPLL